VVLRLEPLVPRSLAVQKDRGLRPDLERRPLDVAFSDPPVEHLLEQLQVVIDDNRRPADLPPRLPPRLDVAEGNAADRSVAEHDRRIRPGQDEVVEQLFAYGTTTYTRALSQSSPARRLRVLLLVTARDQGGAEILAEGLVRALIDRCAFTVVLPSADGVRPLAARLSDHARVVALPLERADGAWSANRAIRRLSREADVVHLNSNHPASRSGAVLALAVSRRTPLVSVEHLAAPVSAVKLPFGFAPWAAAMFRFSRRRAAAFVAVSAENASRLTSEYGIAASRIAVVHGGIDLAPFPLPEDRRLARRQAIGVDVDERMVVVPARQAPNKGHRFLIAAARTVMEQVPRVRFVLAGAGGADPRVVRAIDDAGLADHFTDLGFLPHDEMVEVICAADLLVLPSLAEGFSLVLIEGLAAGAITIASSVGGARELIDDGAQGFLVPPGDVDALARAILLGLRLDARDRQELAAKARARAARFSIGATAEKMIAVYERAIGNLATSRQRDRG
jgi:glycosyltransferase involved in cell wall biosynthesis